MRKTHVPLISHKPLTTSTPTLACPRCLLMAPPDAQVRNLVSSDSLLASRLVHPGTNAGQPRAHFPLFFSILWPYDGHQSHHLGLNRRHPELGILTSLLCTFPCSAKVSSGTHRSVKAGIVSCYLQGHPYGFIRLFKALPLVSLPGGRPRSWPYPDTTLITHVLRTGPPRSSRTELPSLSAQRPRSFPTPSARAGPLLTC